MREFPRDKLQKNLEPLTTGHVEQCAANRDGDIRENCDEWVVRRSQSEEETARLLARANKGSRSTRRKTHACGLAVCEFYCAASIIHASRH